MGRQPDLDVLFDLLFQFRTGGYTGLWQDKGLDDLCPDLVRALSGRCPGSRPGGCPDDCPDSCQDGFRDGSTIVLAVQGQNDAVFKQDTVVTWCIFFVRQLNRKCFVNLLLKKHFIFLENQAQI